MSFPTSIPSYQGFIATDTLAADNHAAQHNQEQVDISALASKVGLTASTPTANTFLRGTGTGNSAWQQVNLATDTTGVLSTSQGGTGSSSAATGTGGVVLQTSPSLTTPSLSNPTVNTGGTFNGNPNFTGQPTISDFTNANHAHDNARDGGQLNAGNALLGGSVTYANLLSTIFSGQVTNYNNGSGMGTYSQYLNLGGVKIMWGASGAVGTSTTPASGTLYLPTFFSNIQSVILTEFIPSGTGNVIAYIDGTPGSNPTSLGISWTATGGSGATQFYFLIIGN